MFKITEKTLKESLKPYDVVTDKYGNVGFIREVNVNSGQEEPHQISYSVEWMVGLGDKNAWFIDKELTRHCNIFIKIAECSCHPFGNSARRVEELFKSGF